MNKAYSRINWENAPSEATPLNEDNLNRIDAGLDETDNRIITLDTTKFDKVDAQMLVKQISYNQATGIFTITYFNDTTFTIDTLLEKLAVNFDFDPETQQLVIILDDGTTKYVDLSALLTQYEFLDSDTIGFVIGEDGKVSAKVKEGSIGEKHLRPDYLADVKVEVAKAEASATAAGASEAKAKASENAAKASETAAKVSEDNAAESASGAAASKEVATQKAEDAAESATTATQKATEAESSASAAATSATNAADSEENAAISANNASTLADKAEAAATEAEDSASAALDSKNAAKESEDKAKISETNAEASKTASANSASTASTKALEAAISASNAENSATTATQKSENAGISEANAAASANTATAKANAASISAENAAVSATSADTYSKQAQSYAVGTGGVRPNESIDSAKYYYEQSKNISAGLKGALLPMGTVTFANLPQISEVESGWTYNILDEFITNNTFKEGEGHVIPAGANVYKTADGFWDILAGTPVSSVNGQTGNVEINLETIDGVLPIAKGGTGANNSSAAADNILGNLRAESESYEFTDDDDIIWTHLLSAGTRNAYRTKFTKLINYIKTKLATVATSGSYNDLSNKPTTMKNPKALTFTGGVSETYDGSAAKSVAIPTTLPANGGTAETISATLPISKGGTGQTTGQAAMNALANSADIGTAMPADDDWYLAQWTGGGTSNTNVVRRKTSSLWNYIKAKCNALYLQLSGGTMTGTIASSKTTATYLKGSQGEAIINSTASAGAYTALSKLNSTNGFFTDVIYQKSRQLIYMAKTTVDAGTNSPTKAATLLDESGNSSFPGTVTAPTFKGKLTGNADTATKLGTATVGAANRPIYLNAGVATVIGNKLQLVDGITAQNVLSFYDDGDTANYGGELVIQGCGNTFIGAGEAADHLRTALQSAVGTGESYAKSSEKLYITSDNEIFLYAGCNTIANRAGMKLSSVSAADAYVATLAPLVNELANLGTNALKFHEVHAATFHGDLTGIAYEAGKLSAGGLVASMNQQLSTQYMTIASKELNKRSFTFGIAHYGSGVTSADFEEVVMFGLGNTLTASSSAPFLSYDIFPNAASRADMLYLGNINSSITKSLTIGLISEMVEARSNINSSGWAPMYAESFTKQSSRKYKKDIEDITKDEARKILDIGIVSFKYKEDKSERVHFGCIVEDVVGIIESVVTYKNGEPDGVDYSKFVPHLIKMAQIHEDIIQDQAKEIAELKGTISELNDRIQRLEDMI